MLEDSSTLISGSITRTKRSLLNTVMLTRIAGVLLIFVFIVNVYLGLYDTNLKMVMLHYDLNWIIAVGSLVGAVFLLLKPTSMVLVTLGGVIWPILFAISLGVDVGTKMCLGVPAANCEPSRTAAFYYLILNYANINTPNSVWMGGRTCYADCHLASRDRVHHILDFLEFHEEK